MIIGEICTVKEFDLKHLNRRRHVLYCGFYNCQMRCEKCLKKAHLFRLNNNCSNQEIKATCDGIEATHNHVDEDRKLKNFRLRS